METRQIIGLQREFRNRTPCRPGVSPSRKRFLGSGRSS